MTLIRAVGRTLMASYFVASGVKAVRKPALYAAEAQPVTDAMVGAVKKYAPAEVAGYIPEDTETLVRINGVLQVAGGLALATGKGRRLGAWLLAYSLVPATVARHPFWKETDADARSAERSHFLKNVALLGGVIVAARDTEGQPGLRWRTAAGAHAISKGGQRVSRKISKRGHSIGDSISDLGESLSESISGGADAAVASGLALAGAVATQSRKARREAAKQAAVAQKKAEKLAKKNAPKLRKQAEQARKQAEKLAKKNAPKLRKQAEQAQKAAAKQAKELQKRAKPLQKAAAKQAASLGKDVKHRAEDVRKTVGGAVDNVTKNIELGSN